MPNPVALAKAAAASKWGVDPVNVATTGRQRGAATFDHPTETGRKMLVLQNGAAGWHIGDGPYTEADEVNTDWQATTGAWQWEMLQADYNTFARDTFNAGNLFQFDFGGEWIAFDPQSINWINQDLSREQIAIKQAVTAVANEDALSFTDAYGSGRHFTYKNEFARLQKIIQLDAPLPAPTITGTIWFEVEFSLSFSSGIEAFLDGVLWEKQNGVRVQTANEIEFRDAGQNVIFTLEKPRAYDRSTGDQQFVIGEMEVRRQGGPSSLFITVRIPKTWIDTAVYPVFVDPSVNPQVGTGTDDARETGAGNVEDGTNLRLNSSTPWAGYRWSSVAVSGGVTVNDCYIDIYGDHPSLIAFDAKAWDFAAEDSAAAISFGSTSDLSTRTLTGNAVAADITLSTSAFTSTPSNVSACQAVLDRGGWSSGNAMLSTFEWDDVEGTGNAQWSSYDDNSSLAAKLFIDYTAAGGDSFPAWAASRLKQLRSAVLRM